MSQTELPPELSTTELVREAVGEVRSLFKAEMQLARDEVRRELAKARTSAISLSLGLVLGTLGLNVLLVAFALFIFPRPLPALIVALAFLVAAAVAGGVGYAKRPGQPLRQTAERLREDAAVLSGHPGPALAAGPGPSALQQVHP